MRYIVPLFDCFLFNTETILLNKFATYRIENYNNTTFLVVGKNTESPFILDFKKSANCQIVKVKNDEYYFLHSKENNETISNVFKVNNKMISVATGVNLSICIEDEILYNSYNPNLNFSHYENFGDFCFLHFIGKRNFVAAIKQNKLCCATYYDEFNKTETKKIFMCKQFDSLNHGKVFSFTENSFEEYLVYLDNNDLQMKNEFVVHIFLDCLIATNYKYCNDLLSSDLKLSNCQNISNFFPEFDFYYPIENNIVILFKKNTLAGIYKFEVDNLNISNITQLE